MEWFCKSISVSARRPEIYLLRWYLHFNLAMLPLLNYQSYKITFTIMISLLSVPFPEWFFCSNSKIRNKKNRKKKLQNFQKKSMSWSGIRSGPVRSTGSGVPIRSGPVRFRKSRSGRLLVQMLSNGPTPKETWSLEVLPHIVYNMWPSPVLLKPHLRQSTRCCWWSRHQGCAVPKTSLQTVLESGSRWAAVRVSWWWGRGTVEGPAGECAVWYSVTSPEAPWL